MFANRFFGNGWGENGFGGPQATQNIEVQDQLSALREQMNSNQNSNLLMDAIKGNNTAIGQLAGQLNCDFNTLNSAICDVRGGIDKLSGQVGFSAERVINAINLGDSTLSRQLSECCCTLRDSITRQGYENQIATLNQTNVLQNATNGVNQTVERGFCNTNYATAQQTNTLQNAINFVNSSVERGFSATNYATAQQTCAIEKAIENSTAQILAGQRAAEMREMQREIQTLRDEKAQYQLAASQQNQTASLVNQLRPCPIPAYITCNPFGCQSDYYPYSTGNCGC